MLGGWSVVGDASRYHPVRVVVGGVVVGRGVGVVVQVGGVGVYRPGDQ